MTPHALMVTHARTFSAAAGWLAPNARSDIETVYAFCRVVDDLADEAGDAEALARIADELDGAARPGPLTAPLLALRRKGVPVRAAAQLVEGARSDLGPVRFPDSAALLGYAYRVAGTVGLLTTPLFGVTDKDAIPHAVNLGIAMQLTNIARDVGEDALRDRVYLPTQWLADAGLTERDVLERRNEAALVPVVHRLLDLAEQYYASGMQGLRYLPIRPRLAVTLAARRYRAIGRLVRRRGTRALRQRTVLGPVSRLLLGIASTIDAVLCPLTRPRTPGSALEPSVAALVAVGRSA